MAEIGSRCRSRSAALISQLQARLQSIQTRSGAPLAAMSYHSRGRTLRTKGTILLTWTRAQNSPPEYKAFICTMDDPGAFEADLNELASRGFKMNKDSPLMFELGPVITHDSFAVVMERQPTRVSERYEYRVYASRNSESLRATLRSSASSGYSEVRRMRFGLVTYVITERHQ